jgi:integrase
VIRLGFLNYLDQIASAPGDPVFPDLTGQGPDAKLGTSITKWFGRYRKEVGISEATVVFHSLRHTFTTRGAEAGISEVMLDALTGHRSAGETSGRYTKAKSFAPATLLIEISKIEFPELDHLDPMR